MYLLKWRFSKQAGAYYMVVNQFLWSTDKAVVDNTPY